MTSMPPDTVLEGLPFGLELKKRSGFCIAPVKLKLGQLQRVVAPCDVMYGH